MKLDKHFTFVRVCPTTGEYMSQEDEYRTGGVCPRCAYDSGSSITHTARITGKWNRPTLWEKLKGIQPEFIPHE